MAEAASHELIIIRRHEEEEHEHHSSAWKVAHADFMTAMMAFFLIMWLINVTDDEIRKGISQYFNPIHMSQGQTELKGLNKAETTPPTKGGKRGYDDQSTDAFNPMKMSAAHAEEKALDDPRASPPADGAGEAAAHAQVDDPASAGAHAQVDDPASAGADAEPAPTGADAGAVSAAGSSAAASERAAFQDPYAVLAKLAQEYSAEHALDVDVIVADDRPLGMAGGEVDRDPFDPAYWQLTNTPPARALDPGEPGSAPEFAEAPLPDAAAALSDDMASASAAVSADHVEMAASPAAATTPGGDATTIAEATIAATQALDAEIAEAVKQTMAADASPQLSIKATSEGILINLTDDADFSMFEVGSAIPNAKVVVLMEEIAEVLKDQAGEVVVRGHTDARPFRSDAYDNWRLSAARAHMAYYMLTRGGLDESRVVTIEGYADRSLKSPSDPYAADNRRIEILLREAR